MKHKIAILSDVHGNVTALQEVVKDVKEQACTETWFMGDLIMPGPGGDDLLELLEEANTSTYIKGNWEDLYMLDDLSQVDLEDPQDTYFTELSLHVQREMSKENIKIIMAHPLHVKKKVEDLNISLSHNLPEKNWGQDLFPTNDTKSFDILFEDKDIDIAIVGHTHRQYMRPTTGGQLVINPGSIGQEFSDREKFFHDKRARYAILEIDEQGLAGVNFRRVLYSQDDELALAKERNLPYIELYESQLDTGITYTHKRDILKEVANKYGYQEEVEVLVKEQDNE